MIYRIAIGYDRNEVAAYHTLCNSILTRATKPVQIVPLYEPTLRAANLYWRQERGSTDFSFTRFLTPYLFDYKGPPALFLDCDMVCLGDITELWDYIGGYQAISVCHHEYRPKNSTKFLGNKQITYPRKLWSAVILFAMGSQKVRNLTPKAVNEMSGADLHQFTWAGNDAARIGSLPEEWHYIPGHSSDRVKLEDAKLIHFTEGGPWFAEYKDCEGAEIWRKEHAKIL